MTSPANAAILDGMPQPADLRVDHHGGETFVTAGQMVIACYPDGDVAMRNVAVAVARQLGFSGQRVAQVMGLTASYVATLHQRRCGRARPGWSARPGPSRSCPRRCGRGRRGGGPPGPARRRSPPGSGWRRPRSAGTWAEPGSKNYPPAGLAAQIGSHCSKAMARSQSGTSPRRSRSSNLSRNPGRRRSRVQLPAPGWSRLAPPAWWRGPGSSKVR